MALRFRGGNRSCQGRATEVGPGDPCRLNTRVDESGRRFIGLFVGFFNRHLWPSRVDFKARQNGFTTAKTTITIISTVGASFKAR